MSVNTVMSLPREDPEVMSLHQTMLLAFLGSGKVINQEQPRILLFLFVPHGILLYLLKRISFVFFRSCFGSLSGKKNN